MRHTVVLLVLTLACAPGYKSATLSTMAAKTRVTMADSSLLDVKQPEVRHDTLYSQNVRPIPVDSVSRVEVSKEDQTSPGTIVGIVLGISLGAWLSQQ